jgi:tetratricopeptide (TPR) repeat protein
MIICNKCGTPNEDHQIYCIHCQYRFPLRRQPITTAQVIQSDVRQIPAGISYPANGSLIAETYPETGARLEDLIERNLREQRRPQSEIIIETPQAAPSFQNPPTPQSTVVQEAFIPKKNYTWLLAGIFAAGLLISGSALFFLLSSKEPIIPNSSLFAEAENLYHSGNHAAALVKYQEFVDNNPGNALYDLATIKIAEITKMPAPAESEKNDENPQPAKSLTEEELKQITGWMKEAKTAYLRNRYLTPAEGNAIFYVSQILKLDPHHAGAQEIQNKIVAFYREKADAALEEKAYSTAHKYYSNLLEILPKDAYARQQINKIPKKSH